MASSLRVSGCGQSTKGADVLRTLGMNVLGGLTLEASYHSGCGRGRVGDINGVVAGTSDSHNHFQSSGQSNASRAHCWSSSSVNSRPTSLSRSSIPPVTFSGGKGVRSARGKGICSLGQLGKWVDCSVSGGYRVGGRRGSSRARGAGFDKGKRGSMIFLFLNCFLHCVIGAIVGLSLSLRQREDNGSENHSEVVSR